jgi:subfamily B ATP-binding cassette protein MsbA
VKEFWKFARMMLRYRGLIALAAVGALIDAASSFGGYASLVWVVNQLIKSGTTANGLLAAKLADPLVVKWIGDHRAWADVVPTDKFQGFAFVLVFIFVLAVVGSVGRYIHQYNIITVALRTIMTIRKHLFARMIHLPMATVNTDGVADYTSRIVRDTNQLSGGINSLMGRAVRDILQGGSLLTLALLVNWRLTGLFLTIAPPVALLIRRFGKRIRRATKKALAGYAVMLGGLNESLQSLRVVKVHGAEGYERRRFSMINRLVLGQEMRSRGAKALSAPIIELIAMLGFIFVAMVAGWYVFRLGQDPADLVNVLMLLVGAGAAFRPLTNLSNDLQEAAAAAGRIDEAMRLPIESARFHSKTEKWERIPRHRKSVAFENVVFGYPKSERPALRGVTLSVPQGRTCAVVGPNGSGKSTLLSLVPRLYEPTSGRVLIDGVDVGRCTLRSLRRQIAVVTQDTVLFDGTIAENISYGMRQTAREKVVAAAKQAHADEFIGRLPQGYDTAIGEWGSRLSGGQRQRIAIARAILRDPAILILDEATSQIDADSEAKITESLAEFSKGRTTFVIAHRLSTVVNAEMIVVMVDGTISAIGRHAELLKTSDVYRTLCRTQLHGLEPEVVS